MADRSAQCGCTDEPSTSRHTEPNIPLRSIPQIGIEVLYEPASNVPIVADVVFVHGLKGHPVKTWLFGNLPSYETVGTVGEEKGSRRLWPRWRNDKAKRPLDEAAFHSKPKHCYWPSQLLPQTFESLRILTYGYDSHPTHFFASKTTRLNITQHKEDLLNRVTGARSRCRGRPLIFIAHSLGGILVKGAITESLRMEKQSTLQDLGMCCKAIVFFGTPHLGADVAAFGKVVSDIVGAMPGGPSTNSKVLHGLVTGSEVLYTIERDFNRLLDQHMIPARKIQICSFQEGQGLSRFKGLSRKVVPDYSSKLNRPNIERSFFVQDANHMDMCRISSPSATAFKDLVPVLEDYLQMIKSHAEDEGGEHGVPSPAPPNVYVATDTAVSSLPASRPSAHMLTENSESTLLEALNFAERTMREQQLNDLWSEEGSFVWVWASQLGEWLRTMEPFFWVAGKPASGKSTLINYVSKADRLKDVLSTASPGIWCVVYHFFDFRAGTGIANNLSGVLRDLIYQLFRKLPDVAQQTKTKFAMHDRADVDWVTNTTLLRRALNFALLSAQRPVLLFLDGLDEYEGNMIELTRWTKDLAHTNIKVCLSSRPEPVLLNAFTGYPMLRMEIENTPGITSFLVEMLQTLEPLSHYKAEFITKVAGDIASRSQGVFLWARFAVYEVIEGETSGEDSETIQKRLERLPTELGDIYSRIFRRMDAEGTRVAGVFLHLVTTSVRTLHLSELLEAAVLANAISRNTNTIINEESLRSFQRRIVKIGGGVLETVPSGYSSSPEHPKILDVRLIHRTVQTYLEKGGWSELFQDDPHRLRPRIWLDVCAIFLHEPSKILAWSCLEPAPVQRTAELPAEIIAPIAQCSLGPYIYANLPFILRSMPENERPCWPEISHLFTKELVSEHVRLGGTNESVQRCFCPDAAVLAKNVTSGIQVAVIHGMVDYVEEYLAGCTGGCPPSSCSLPQKPTTPTDGISYQQNNAPVVDVQDLYRLAALCADDRDDGDSTMLQLLSSFVTKPLDDSTMLRLLREGTVRDIEICLDRFPQGKLILKSSFFCICYDRPRHCRCKSSPSEQEYSPLWPIVYRHTGKFEAEETPVEERRRLFELFISRGEDVNGRNGPHGTLLHAIVMRYFLINVYMVALVEWFETLEFLVLHGAKPNALDPDANPLEYCWKYIHTTTFVRGPVSPLYGGKTRQLVNKLLDMGMKNRRKDPNGLVPILERMANVGRFYTEYGPSGTKLTALSERYAGEKGMIVNSGRVFNSKGFAENDWSAQSWCMEKAYYHFGDPDRWEEFFDERQHIHRRYN